MTDKTCVTQRSLLEALVSIVQTALCAAGTFVKQTKWKTRKRKKHRKEGHGGTGTLEKTKGRQVETMGRRCDTLERNQLASVEGKHAGDKEQMLAPCSPQKYPYPSCAVLIRKYKHASQSSILEKRWNTSSGPQTLPQTRCFAAVMLMQVGLD